MSDDKKNANLRDKSEYEINPDDYISSSTSQDMKEELSQMKVNNNVQSETPTETQPVKKKFTISPQFVAVETENKKGKKKVEYVAVSNNTIDEQGNVVIADTNVNSANIKAHKSKHKEGVVPFILGIVFFAIAGVFMGLTYAFAGSVSGAWHDMINNPAAVFLLIPILMFLLIMGVTVLPVLGFGIASVAMFGGAWHADSKAIRVLSIIFFIVALVSLLAALAVLAIKFFAGA